MNRTIGNRIQTLRKQNGMSQQSLSEKLNISRQTISKWESNQSLPDLDILLKMAELFDVSIAHIVGVEEDNKTISQMYELMQTLLNNQQKSTKSRNIIQILTIILCIISLGLNISMRADMNRNQTSTIASTNGHCAMEVAYGFTKDKDDVIEDNLYLMDGSTIKVAYYDLNAMMVNLQVNFYLSSYSNDTKIWLDFYKWDELISIPLSQIDGYNFGASNIQIPINDYTQVMLRIEEKDGTIKTSDLTDSIPNNFFSYVLFSHINLFVPIDSQGNLQLNQIDFNPVYYNTPNDNYFIGDLNGSITIRIYTKNKHWPTEILATNFEDRRVFALSEVLPVDEPIYFEISYDVITPNSDIPFNGRLGYLMEDNGTVDYFSFTIKNTNERYRILQIPDSYSQDTDTYYFKN